MAKFIVRCGELSLTIEKKRPENAKHAALEAMQYWYDDDIVVFPPAVTVTNSRGKELIFSTINLMKELGIELEKGKNNGKNEIHKPRLCEYTAQQFFKSIQSKRAKK
jgi:hypothetical protein